MLIKLVKNKKNWTIWLAISLTGGVIGLYLNFKNEKIINSSQRCFANIYGDKKSIFVIQNKTYLNRYIDFHQNPTKYLPFPLKTIKYNQEVLIIDTLKNGSILQIRYFAKHNSNSLKVGWNDAFIYKNYLQNCSSKNK